MPVIKIPGNTLECQMIAFDEEGRERSEPSGLISQQILDILSNQPVTDIFLISHGWLSDIPAAIDQYSNWIRAMADNYVDIQNMQELRPNFLPLIIGIHWPSKPLGDEYLDLTTDPEQRDLTQFDKELVTAKKDVQSLTSDWKNDFGSGEGLTLFEQIKQRFQSKQGSIKQIVDRKLTEFLSYWDMKERARQIGQTGGFEFLTKLQKQTSDQVKFHLVGHSFGTIMVSSMLRGSESKSQLVRPVHSLTLIQGAVSLWSFCQQVPERDNLMGYFHPVISERKVSGPIVTTNSKYDYSVKSMYPLASRIGLKTRGQDVDFNVSFSGQRLPIFGGIGTYGIQGSGLSIRDSLMKNKNEEYSFSPNVIHNLASDNFIRDGFKDAHCAIAKPEVAHAIWSAALCT